MSTFILSYQVVEPIWSDSTAAYCLGDVLSFLEKDDLAPATSSKLLKIINDPAKFRKLKMELVITVDRAILSKPTYILEGDGALA